MSVFVRPWGQQPHGRYPAWRQRLWPWRYKVVCSTCHKVHRGWQVGKLRAIDAGLRWLAGHWHR